MEQFQLTQEEISKKVGKDRTTVANTVRLLKLPPEIKLSLTEGKITMGHARAFLSLDGVEKQKLLLKRLLTGGLSVRQTESLVKRLRTRSSPAPRRTDPEWGALIEELQQALGTKIRIVGKRKRGKIEIDFYSPEELDRIVELLRR
jgi:ParB family chromosome partitioning protein